MTPRERGAAQLSSNDTDGAIESLERATAIDSVFARGLFLQGTALLAAGRTDEARALFVRAKDEDVCPLRALSSVQAVVATVAADAHAAWIDFPELLGSESEALVGHDIVGKELFLDHVHPTIDGHRLLAEALHAELVRSGVAKPLAQTPQVAAEIERDVLAGIDSREHARALSNLAQLLSWAGKNAEALRLAERAMASTPDNAWIVVEYARLLQENGRSAQAIEHYNSALKLDPENPLALWHVAKEHLGRHQYGMAQELLGKAIRATPDSYPIAFRSRLHLELGRAQLRSGRRDEAIRSFRAVLAIDPRSREAKLALQGAGEF